MKAKTKHQKGRLSFYLVLLVCMIMISAACWFAYAQTKNQIVLNLESSVDSMEDVRVMEMETAIPRETVPETEPETETQPQTQPETELITQPVMIQPLQTAPTETQPLTQQAAVIDAPETAPQVQETELSEADTPEAEPTSAEPPCWPLNGEILEVFSNGELVKSSTTGIWQTHNGIDISGTLGDAVCSVNEGIVKAIENDPLWGVTVLIDHQNGITTRYCSLNSGLSVSVGDKTDRGTVIGALGDTADIESSMSTHLHFEVMQGDHYIDPMSYLGAQSTEPTE